MDRSYRFQDLIEVMQALRDPEKGCPWDLEQDFQSIVPYTLEEAYEVADAIENNNLENLCEELGDLLLQPVYLAQIAAENNHFTIHDVIQDITNKMIERHPHVFGDQHASSPEDVNKIWDQKKAQKNSDAYILDSIPAALPALVAAQKMQNKAAKVGFEWPNTKGVLKKLKEEIAELDQAIENKDEENIVEEIGDILFVLVNFSRMHSVDAETALRKCNAKFKKRLSGLEDDIKADGKGFSDYALDELIALWNAQKNKF